MKPLLKVILVACFLSSSPLLFAFPDSSANIGSRIQSIQNEVPLLYNSETHQKIQTYRKNSQGHTANILGKAAFYLPQISQILREEGLPDELKYLPMAVSGFDHLKVSSSGGSGFWQMNYRNAVRQNLHISTYVDERRDWLKSSRAAALELKNHYATFKKWPLAIAAFYCDETDVQIAIRMAGGNMEFSDIQPYLPAEVREVMSSFTAAAYMLNYYTLEELEPEVVEWPDTTCVHPTDWLSFSQLQIALDISLEELRLLNPIFKKKVIPHAARSYTLSLPIEKALLFSELGDSIYRIDPGNYMPGGEQPAEPAPPFTKPEVTPEPDAAARTSSQNQGTTSVYYTVRSGEYLGLIADIFDANISDVRRWNGLRGDRINAGQRLKMYVPTSKADYYRSMNNKSAAQKRQIANAD